MSPLNFKLIIATIFHNYLIDYAYRQFFHYYLFPHSFLDHRFTNSQRERKVGTLLVDAH